MNRSNGIALGIGIGVVADVLLFSGKNATAGAYGVDVVPIDMRAEHAEIVANPDTGELMVCTWDKHPRSSRPIEAGPITLGTDDGRVDLSRVP